MGNWIGTPEPPKEAGSKEAGSHLNYQLLNHAKNKVADLGTGMKSLLSHISLSAGCQALLYF
jgi:hypothetical protein